ncbi:MAG: hypothetical protein M3Q73_03825 [bacterium]|nr:hypothetical protein [bacterium]
MSNSTGWAVAVVILLLLIAGGAYMWVQSNADEPGTNANIETVLPLGGGN